MAGRTAPKRRTQEERTAESTRRLVRAAIELIAEKGFASTTTAEIGERAGYSRSMVQFKYGTKEALLESLMREEYETRVLLPMPPGTSGLARLLRQVDDLRDGTVEDPELMRGFFALCFEAVGPLPSLSAWIKDWLARYQSATADSIRAGQEDGSIRPDVDPETEARAFIASGVGYAFRLMVSPEQIRFPAALDHWREQLRERLSADRIPL